MNKQGMSIQQAQARRQELNVQELESRLQRSGNAGKKERLRTACQDFEAVFIGQIWKQMRSSVPKDGMLHSKEEESYLSMFDQELSRKMAHSGGIGLGDMLYDNLSQRLDKVSKDTSSPGPLNPLKNPVAAQKTRMPETLASLTVRRQVDELAESIESRVQKQPETGEHPPETDSPSRAQLEKRLESLTIASEKS